MENQMQGQAVVKNGGKLDPNKVSQTISLFTEAGVPINLGSGGEGGGQVDSIVAGENITVNNTDPANPVISAAGGGQVDSIVAGENITVDNSDPENPVISSSGGGGSVTPEPVDIIAVEPGGLAITGPPRTIGLLWGGEGDDERVVTLPQATSDDEGKVWVVHNLQHDGEITVEVTMGPGQTQDTVLPRAHTLSAKVVDGTDAGQQGMYMPFLTGFYPRERPDNPAPLYWAPSGWKYTAEILDEVTTPAPSSGTYSLKSVDGFITWVEDE